VTDDSDDDATHLDDGHSTSGSSSSNSFQEDSDQINLTKRVSDLEILLSSTATELKVISEQLTEEQTAFTSERLQFVSAVDGLKSELSHRESEFVALQRAYDSLMEQNMRQQQETELLSNQNKDLHAKNASLFNSNRASSQELVSLIEWRNDVHTTLSAKLSALEHQNKILTDQNMQLTRSRDDAVTEFQKLQGELDGVQRTLRDLTIEMHEENSRLQSELETAMQGNKAAVRELKAAASSKLGFLEKVATQASELADLREQVKSKDKKLSDKQKHWVETELQNKRLLETVEAQRRRLVELLLLMKELLPAHLLSSVTDEENIAENLHVCLVNIGKAKLDTEQQLKQVHARMERQERINMDLRQLNESLSREIETQCQKTQSLLHSMSLDHCLNPDLHDGEDWVQRLAGLIESFQCALVAMSEENTSLRISNRMYADDITITNRTLMTTNNNLVQIQLLLHSLQDKASTIIWTASNSSGSSSKVSACERQEDAGSSSQQVSTHQYHDKQDHYLEESSAEIIRRFSGLEAAFQGIQDELMTTKRQKDALAARVDQLLAADKLLSDQLETAVSEVSTLRRAIEAMEIANGNVRDIAYVVDLLVASIESNQCSLLADSRDPVDPTSAIPVFAEEIRALRERLCESDRELSASISANLVLHAEVSNLKATNLSLECEVSKATTSAQIQDARIMQLISERSTTEQWVATLQHQLQDLQVLVAKQKEESDDKVQSKESRIIELTKEFEEFRMVKHTELKSFNQQLADFTSQLKLLENKLHIADENLEISNRQLLISKLDSESLCSRIAVCDRHIAELASQLSAVQEDRNDLIEKLQRASDGAAASQSEADMLCSLKMQQQQLIESLKEERKRLKTNVMDLHNEVERLKGGQISLQQRISTLEEIQAKKDAEILASNDEHRFEIQKMVSSHNQSISRLEMEIAAASRFKSDQVTAMTTLRQQLIESHKEIARLSESLIHEKERLMEEHRASLEQANTDCANCLVTLKDKLLSTEHQLQASNERLAEADSELASALATNFSVQAFVSSLTETNTMLTSQISDFERKLEELQASHELQLRSMRENIADLEGAVAGQREQLIRQDAMHSIENARLLEFRTENTRLMEVIATQTLQLRSRENYLADLAIAERVNSKLSDDRSKIAQVVFGQWDQWFTVATSGLLSQNNLAITLCESRMEVCLQRLAAAVSAFSELQMKVKYLMSDLRDKEEVIKNLSNSKVAAVAELKARMERLELESREELAHQHSSRIQEHEALMDRLRTQNLRILEFDKTMQESRLQQELEIAALRSQNIFLTDSVNESQRKLLELEHTISRLKGELASSVKAHVAFQDSVQSITDEKNRLAEQLVQTTVDLSNEKMQREQLLKMYEALCSNEIALSKRVTEAEECSSYRRQRADSMERKSENDHADLQNRLSQAEKDVIRWQQAADSMDQKWELDRVYLQTRLSEAEQDTLRWRQLAEAAEKKSEEDHIDLQSRLSEAEQEVLRWRQLAESAEKKSEEDRIDLQSRLSEAEQDAMRWRQLACSIDSKSKQDLSTCELQLKSLQDKLEAVRYEQVISETNLVACKAQCVAFQSNIEEFGIIVSGHDAKLSRANQVIAELTEALSSATAVKESSASEWKNLEAQLSAKVSMTEAALAAKESEVYNLTQRLSSTEVSLKQQQQIGAELQSTIEDLRKQVAAARAETAGLQREHNDSLSNLSVVRSRFEEAVESTVKVSQELRVVRVALKEKESKLATLEDLSAARSAQLIVSDTKIRDLSAQLVTAQQREMLQQSNVELKSTQMLALQAETDHLMEKVSKQKQEIDALRKLVDEQSTSADARRVAIQELTLQNVELFRSDGDQKTELARHASVQGRLQQRLNQVDAEVADSRTECRRLQEDIRILRESVISALNMLFEAVHSVGMNETIPLKQPMLEEKSITPSALSSIAESLRNIIDTMNRDLALAQEQLFQFQASRTQLETAIASITGTAAPLHDRIATLVADLAVSKTTEESTENERKKLQNYCDELHRIIAEIRLEGERKTVEIARLEIQNCQLCQQFQEVQVQSKQLHHQNTDEIASLRVAVSTLQEKLDLSSSTRLSTAAAGQGSEYLPEHQQKSGPPDENYARTSREANSVTSSHIVSTGKEGPYERMLQREQNSSPTLLNVMNEHDGDLCSSVQKARSCSAPSSSRSTFEERAMRASFTVKCRDLEKAQRMNDELMATITQLSAHIQDITVNGGHWSNQTAAKSSYCLIEKAGADSCHGDDFLEQLRTSSRSMETMLTVIQQLTASKRQTEELLRAYEMELKRLTDTEGNEGTKDQRHRPYYDGDSAQAAVVTPPQRGRDYRAPTGDGVASVSSADTRFSAMNGHPSFNSSATNNLFTPGSSQLSTQSHNQENYTAINSQLLTVKNPSRGREFLKIQGCLWHYQNIRLLVYVLEYVTFWSGGGGMDGGTEGTSKALVERLLQSLKSTELDIVLREVGPQEEICIGVKQDTMYQDVSKVVELLESMVDRLKDEHSRKPTAAANDSPGLLQAASKTLLHTLRSEINNCRSHLRQFKEEPDDVTMGWSTRCFAEHGTSTSTPPSPPSSPISSCVEPSAVATRAIRLPQLEAADEDTDLADECPEQDGISAVMVLKLELLRCLEERTVLEIRNQQLQADNAEYQAEADALRQRFIGFSTVVASFRKRSWHLTDVRPTSSNHIDLDDLEEMEGCRTLMEHMKSLSNAVLSDYEWLRNALIRNRLVGLFVRFVTLG
jgi:chromosome segregation ATPase